MKSCFRSVVRQSATRAAPRRRRRGIRHLDRKALRGEEAHEPAAHLAGAADDQRAPPAAGAVRDHARVLLGRERGADQQAQQLLGELGRDAALGGQSPARPGSRRARARNRASACRWRASRCATCSLTALRSATSVISAPVDVGDALAQLIQRQRCRWLMAHS